LKLSTRIQGTIGLIILATLLTLFLREDADQS